MRKMGNIKRSFKQFALYLVVGSLATLVEWITFYMLSNVFSLHYMIATVFAFMFSTFANWLFGRLILFQAREKLCMELLKIYLTSIAGLLFNLLIMWIEVEYFFWNQMLSKVIATGIVFFWNFLVRKCLIYRP